MIDGWTPGIGDPDLLGWLTVAAYLGAAMVCWWAAGGDAARRFWLALAAVLVALGINKQLDLQSLLTAVARQAAKTNGWYAERRGVQFGFIVAIAALGLVGMTALTGYLRRFGAAARWAGAGCAALIVFVIVRAASFHHVDALLKSGVGGVRVNHLLELGGIGVIAAAATASIRQHRPA